MLGPSMAVACARFSEAHAEKPAATACSNRRRPRFKLFKRVVQFEQIVKKRKDQVLLIRRGGPRPDGVRILRQRSILQCHEQLQHEKPWKNTKFIVLWPRIPCLFLGSWAKISVSFRKEWFSPDSKGPPRLVLTPLVAMKEGDERTEVGLEANPIASLHQKELTPAVHGELWGETDEAAAALAASAGPPATARDAFEQQDGAGSIAVHNRNHETGALLNNEKHSMFSDRLKSIVYGGLDGIITTFAVVSGATGGGFGVDVIMVLGFSNMVADALSMGVGDAMSTKAGTICTHVNFPFDQRHLVAGRERCNHEGEGPRSLGTRKLQGLSPGLDRDSLPSPSASFSCASSLTSLPYLAHASVRVAVQEGEILEMVDLYEEKGMSRYDAEMVIRIMAKYEVPPEPTASV